MDKKKVVLLLKLKPQLKLWVKNQLRNLLMSPNYKTNLNTTKTTRTTTTESIGGDGAGETTKNTKATKGDAGAKARSKD